MMRYIAWRPTKKHKKIKPNMHAMDHTDLESNISNMSTATTRSWKP